MEREAAIDEAFGMPRSREAAGPPSCPVRSASASQPAAAGRAGLSQLPGITDAHVKRALLESRRGAVANSAKRGFRVPGNIEELLATGSSSLADNMDSPSAESLGSLLSGEEGGADSPMSQPPAMGGLPCLKGGAALAGAAVRGSRSAQVTEEQEESVPLAAALEACVARRALLQYAATARACLRRAHRIGPACSGFTVHACWCSCR